MTVIKLFAFNVLALFPLQIDVHDFGGNFNRSTSPKEVIIIILVMGAIILLPIIISFFMKNKPGMGAVKGGAAGSFFSRFSLNRHARDMGLNREQIKMLDFVFKTDDVIDPQRSLANTELLDRHFRRAYRVIEQTSKTPEDMQHNLAVLFSTRNMLEHTGGINLTSTRQLREDAVLTIGAGKDRREVAVVSTKGDHLAVECPKNALGSYIKAPKGNKLTVFMFSKNNKGFSFESKVAGYSGSMGHTVMLLTHSNQIKKLSQRRYRRRQIVLACNMFLVYVEGKGRKQRLVVDKRRLVGSIADISVGGCSIKSRAPVEVGAKMKIEFTYDDSNLAALGQVLRSNRGSAMTVLHVKFLRVSRKSMNAINAFVYEYADV